MNTMQDSTTDVVADKRERFMQGQDALPGSSDDKKIFKAYDRDQGCEVAMHVVPTSGSDQRTAYQPQELHHEHLMEIIDCWEEPENFIYITEIITAGTLEGYIKRIKEDVRTKVVKKWCRQILSALCFLHGEPLQQPHGDLRLDNVYINGETGNVKVGNFRMVVRSTKSGNPTEAGRFLPPEGDEPTRMGDVYSFGLCLLHMVTREKPYWTGEHETFMEMQSAKLAGVKPHTLSQIESEDMRNFIESCIATNPEDRLTVFQLCEHSWLKDKDKKKREKTKRREKEDTKEEEENGAETSKSSTSTPVQQRSSVNKQDVNMQESSNVPTATVTEQQTSASIAQTTNPNAMSRIATQEDAPTRPTSNVVHNRQQMTQGNHSPPEQSKSSPPPQLLGISFENFQFKRHKISVQMSIFYPHPQQPETTIAYRSILFAISLDDPNESPAQIAKELVDHKLINSKDYDTVANWLQMSLGKILKVAYVYTRDSLPAGLRVSTIKNNRNPQALVNNNGQASPFSTTSISGSAASASARSNRRVGSSARLKPASSSSTRHRPGGSSAKVHGSATARQHLMVRGPHQRSASNPNALAAATASISGARPANTASSAIGRSAAAQQQNLTEQHQESFIGGTPEAQQSIGNVTNEKSLSHESGAQANITSNAAYSPSLANSITSNARSRSPSSASHKSLDETKSAIVSQSASLQNNTMKDETISTISAPAQPESSTIASTTQT